MHIKHTIIRNNTYHFNIRLSDKTYYRKSLKTDSAKLAKILVNKIIIFIKREQMVMKAEITDFIESLILTKLRNVIATTNVILSPISHVAKIKASAFTPTTEYPTYLKRLQRDLNDHAMGNPLQGFYSSSDEPEDIPYFYDFGNNTSYDKYYDNLNTLINNTVNKMTSTDATREIRAELVELKALFADILPKPIPPSPLAPPITNSTSPLYEDILTETFEYHRSTGDKEKIIESMKTASDLFYPAFNGLRIDEITWTFIEDVWRTLQQFPKSTYKDLYGFGLSEEQEDFKSEQRKRAKSQNKWDTLSEGFDLNAILPEHKLKSSTYRGTKAFLTKLFRYAHRKDYISFNPMSEANLPYTIKGETIADKRVKLPDEYVQSLLSHAIADRNNPLNWVVLIMAYHGCRTSEVTNLKKEHIYLNEPIPYIHIKEGKTKTSERIIPIHSIILKLGFEEWLTKQPNTLFSFPASKATLYYSKLREELKIPSKTENEELISLYSLRHNVSSQLIHISQEQKYRLIGHSTKNTTSGYSHLDLPHAKVLVELIKYPVTIP